MHIQFGPAGHIDHMFQLNAQKMRQQDTFFFCCKLLPVICHRLLLVLLPIWWYALQQVPIADAIQRITGNPSLRFCVMTTMALTGIWAIQKWSPGSPSSGTPTTQVAEARQMMTGVLGFMMWKLAVVGVTTVPAQRSQPAMDEIM